VRSFACDTCGLLVFFENTVCLRCRSDLGFEPRRRELVTLSAGAARCANLELAGCNWLADATGERGDFRELLDDWLPLTYALNALSRSMGRDDLYPFVLPAPVVEKLAFVHERVTAASPRD
jgi:hypothetical protein